MSHPRTKAILKVLRRGRDQKVASAILRIFGASSIEPHSRDIGGLRDAFDVAAQRLECKPPTIPTLTRGATTILPLCGSSPFTRRVHRNLRSRRGVGAGYVGDAIERVATNGNAAFLLAVDHESLH